MPKYVFECQTEGCNCRFERSLKMGQHPMHPCPSCKEDAPRCLEGEGFSFGFQATASPQGNTGVHKDDYPTADHAVGKSASSRWMSYEDRKKVKDEARMQGKTHALVRRDGGNYVEYETMSAPALEGRKKAALKTFEAIRVANEAKAAASAR